MKFIKRKTFLGVRSTLKENFLNIPEQAMLIVQISPWRAFLKTTEDFSGPKAIFEIQSLLIQSNVFSPKTSAKFLLDLRSFRLAFKTNENGISVGKYPAY